MKKFIIEKLRYEKPELKCQFCPSVFDDFDELLLHEKTCNGEKKNAKVSTTN
jgi:hypothetical protein